MSSKARTVDPNAKEIPEIIRDPNRPKRYERGKFLGKGGFAKCYELKDMDTKEIMAGKIVPKSLLVKPHQREKMTQEITLHKGLGHLYVVKLFSYFEDDHFVYIILELCRRRSLMELHKRRKAVTEPETRYFMNQILLGCKYLHDSKIIHRDLKLGNIFLNDDMQIKLGDFGLATRVDFDGERKRTLCGTPNYIAPEVLGKKGHSYEVDVWSLGCILYTLLVGRPPFETHTLKETYSRIKNNEYQVPSTVGPLARNLIGRLLQHEPSRRPNINEILRDDFMTKGYLPHRLPVSCLTMTPRFDTKTNMNLIAQRGPLTELNTDMRNACLTSDGMKKPSSGSDNGQLNTENFLVDLQKQLKEVIDTKPSLRNVINEDEAEDPKSLPMVWVSKWVDYSDKYGFGYALSDESIGVLFNDITRLLLLSDGSNIHYIDFEGHEHYYTLTNFPTTLEKKVKLLNYFRNYMKEHLLKAGANIETREGDELSRIPSLKTWFRTSRAVVMQLSNGTLQINFFKDHTKIILCPLMSACTYIDEDKNHRTFRFDLIQKHGCGQELASRLTYAHDKVNSMIASLSKNPQGGPGPRV
eukprot:maker-scaffold784_size97500-snap-gene-0.29 protein:Tk02999 transcript:maker-scaffold784_size97500-snap-gene-0.29-mRNA-1 annotation:"polo-like kinase 1"